MSAVSNPYIFNIDNNYDSYSDIIPNFSLVTMDFPSDINYPDLINGIMSNDYSILWMPTITDSDGNVLDESQYKVTITSGDYELELNEISEIGNYLYTIELLDKNYIFDGPDKDNPDTWDEEPVYIATRNMNVLPGTVVVEAISYTKTQGQADPYFDFISSGYSSYETPGWTGSLQREPGEATGFYSINQGSLQLADNPEGNFVADNYFLEFIPGILVINNAPVVDPDNPGTPIPS